MLNLRQFAFVLIIVLIIFTCASVFAQEPPAASTLTIDEAVRIALENNPDLRAARRQADAARARVDAAESGRLPQVDASVDYRRVSETQSIEIPSPDPDVPPRTIEIGNQDSLVGTVSARQSIFSGGRVSAQISRAEALAAYAESRVNTTEAQLAFQVRQAYYSVLLNLSLVRSAEQDLAAARSQLSAATARFEAGTAPRFDVLRAQTQVSEAEQSLVEARNQVEITQVTLNRLLGVPLSNRYTLAEPQTAPFPSQDMQSLVTTALDQRSEVSAARFQVTAAESGIRIARSERLPDISVAASYQVTGQDNFAQTSGLVLSANASLPIFSGGRISANISEARSLTDEARANLEETTRAVEQDVRQTWLDLSTARQTIETARVRLTQAQEAYDIAVVRYEAGVGTAVELADALATLTAARTNLDRAVANYNITYARLQRALGVTLY
ncbi:MAG: TolC family protein [Armatimonadota bacterium]